MNFSKPALTLTEFMSVSQAFGFLSSVESNRPKLIDFNNLVKGDFKNFLHQKSTTYTWVKNPNL